MNTVICAGGSGARILEAMLHLCAAGAGPERLRILRVDPDGTNGNGTRTFNLIREYIECRELFVRHNATPVLFSTELEVLDIAGVPWSPVQAGGKLHDLVNYSTIGTSCRDVVDLLFTRQERQAELDEGFLGHPAIGAAAMALLTADNLPDPWNTLQQRIRVDVNAGQTRVAILASVFGGTGAAAIHPIARLLRKMPEHNHDRLKITAVVLEPYFSFQYGATDSSDRQTEQEIAARAEHFAIATRAAIEYYDHLKSNGDWEFDSMYWVGDNTPTSVSASRGGTTQSNPAHYVEFLAALAALEAFGGGGTPGACHYVSPRADVEPELGQRNLLEWRDVPPGGRPRSALKRQVMRFFAAGVAHVGFLGPLLERPDIDDRPFCVPWYLDRFARQEDWFSIQKTRDELGVFTKYLRTYFFPWWHQIHAEKSSPPTVRLFNRNAMLDEGHKVDLSRLAVLEGLDRAGEASTSAMDEFFSQMVKVKRNEGTGKSVAGYISLLMKASEGYYRKVYQREEEKEDANV